MAESHRLQFRCPQCHVTLPVSPELRESLRRHGCAHCGGAVTDAAFAPA